ncbi:molecular chaperone DnaJ [Chloroflexota bacterium]
MAQKRDYYEVLGVNKNASGDEIKKSFRKLAFQCHPDHNHEDGTEAKFKELNEAYEVLSDSEKRSAYDRFGHAGIDGFSGQGFEGFGFSGMGSIFEDFYDFFSGSAGNVRQSHRRGDDQRTTVTITLEEAALGCKKEIKIVRYEKCSECDGSGSEPGSQQQQCPTCKGSGRVNRVQQSIFGRFTNVATCAHCFGEGKIISDPCKKCRSTGIEKQKHGMEIDIPAGVANGNEMRLTGEGDMGERGSQSGNLYVEIRVLQHQYFKRDGVNILCELPLNFAQAALGTELKVPTLHGDVKLKVPAGSQAGRLFRLKGRGIAHLRRNGNGDQLVKLVLETPEKLNKQQKKLFQELAKSFDNSDKEKN